VSHGAVFAEEELLAELAQLEEGRCPIFLALDPLSLFFEILKQTGPISRTTKALRYLFPKLHEQATLIEFPGIWMVESRTFYTMCGDGDQLETGTAP
jgi:hypothetical protein